MRLSILAALLTRGSAHYTQTSFSPPVACSDGPRYKADLLASCQAVGASQPLSESLTCRLSCAKAFTALGDYAALCEPAVASDASFRRVAGACSRLEPWRINGAPLTVLPCGAATDAPDGVDAVVMDVSFISQTLILPEVARVLRPGGELYSLVKPQFEVGPGKVDSRGIVRDASLYAAVAETLHRACDSHSLAIDHWQESPIQGGDGNREFLLHALRR